MKLNALAFAITCSLMWGLGLCMITWWIIMFDGPSTETTFLSRVYRGYAMTPKGSVIGLLWALVDGFIGGLIFAWLYNVVAGRVAAKTA
ncbi:MAG: bacteriophage holin [Acidobacteriota bacterium]|nr:bacteriophage holin [Acidobacteriota bacterium]